MVERTTQDLVDLFSEEEDVTLTELVEIIREETDSLAEVLPDALMRQWERSPVPRPRDDTTERATGEKSDPTGDAVMDGRRMQVRGGVREAERLLRQTAIRTRGVRLFLERAVREWDGDTHDLDLHHGSEDG